MPPKTKEFLELQAAWYSKLEKSGFQDIEQDEDNLKQWASSVFKANHNETVFAAKEDYYRLAGQFLNDYPFASSSERLMWELHADGQSIRDIVTTLKKRRVKVYRRLVHETLQRLSEEMIAKCR